MYFRQTMSNNVAKNGFELSGSINPSLFGLQSNCDYKRHNFSVFSISSK